MEEKQVPESMATVNIKPDYPPSEYCASEPPPAYHKPKSSAVQVAKIVAVTVVLVSFILGSFILASAYVTATSSCRQLEQDLELLSEVADRFDGSNNNDGPLQPAALVQDEPKHNKRQTDPLAATKKNIKDIDDNAVDSSDSSSDSSSSTESDEEPKVHFKLPLQLDFDDLAGDLIAKNQRSKMNCIVEKKRAEEVVDHQPKTLTLPFGVNLTTDPRFERLTGERMVIICESGNMQSAQPQQPEKPQQDNDDDDDDDSEQDTIMIQPIMIPIPHTSFQTHMPMQRPEQPQIQILPYHPMESMRPPMPQMRPQMDNMRPQMDNMRPQMDNMRPQMDNMRPQMDNMRPQMDNMRPPMDNVRPPMENNRPPMEQMRPAMGQMRPVMEPMRPPIRPPMDVRIEQSRPPMEQIIAFRQNIEPVRQSIESQRPQEIDQNRSQMMFIPQQVQIRVEPQQPEQQQADASPNPIIQHIIQQIIAQKIMESRKAQEQESQPSQESREHDFEVSRPVHPDQEGPMPHGLPIPEEILTQLNRLPNNDRVIVAVSEPESSEEDSAEDSGESQEMVIQAQQPRQPAQEMSNRQAYIRRLPVNIPVNMMQQHLQEQDQEPQAVASEEMRPHYVQPRSVSSEEPKSRVARSANPLLPEKRVKRCACDCAC